MKLQGFTSKFVGSTWPKNHIFEIKLHILLAAAQLRQLRSQKRDAKSGISQARKHIFQQTKLHQLDLCLGNNRKQFLIGTVPFNAQSDLLSS